VRAVNSDRKLESTENTGQAPYSVFNIKPILYIDPDGRAAIKSLGGGVPISELFKRATNYVVSLTRLAIDDADRNDNPVTIYDNITNPHSNLLQWQAESLAKYSDVAVSSGDFITSISGLSKNEAKRQEPGREPFGLQSGGPTSRYVVDLANSDRVIDMRHFLSIGHMEKTKIYGYFLQNGHLPTGNKIVR